MTFAGHQSLLGAGQSILGVAGEGGEKGLKAFAGGRRKSELKFI